MTFPKGPVTPVSIDGPWDNTSNVTLPVSLYGKNAAAGDTTIGVDSAGNAMVNMGVGLDQFDDNAGSSPAAYYPAQTTFTITSSIASATISLASLSMAGPALFDARSVALYIENKSGQTINSLTLQLSDTIGATGSGSLLLYTAPGVSIANNTVGVVYIPLTLGVLKSPSITVGFAANASSGTVIIQGVWSRQVLSDLPNAYRSTGSATLTTTTATQVLAAPGSGMRLVLDSVTITNAAGASNSVVTITDGNGGTTLDSGFANSPGGFQKTYPRGLPLSVNTPLYAVCGTTGANATVAAQAHIAPA